MISTTEFFGPSCACATSVSAYAKKIAMKRRRCMNVIVVVRGMNVNVRVSEDPIEGIFYQRRSFPQADARDCCRTLALYFSAMRFPFPAFNTDMLLHWQSGKIAGR